MEQLEKKAFWVFLFSRALYYSFIVVFFVWYIFAELGKWSFFSSWFEQFLTIFLLIFFLSAIWAKLYLSMFGFELSSSGLQVKSGVIFRRFVTIPYDRIQNVDLYQGPILTLFGLKEVRIQTAGSAVASRWQTAEGTITGLTNERAEKLKSNILSKNKVGGGL